MIIVHHHPKFVNSAVSSDDNFEYQMQFKYPTTIDDRSHELRDLIRYNRTRFGDSCDPTWPKGHWVLAMHDAKSYITEYKFCLVTKGYS